MQLLGTKNLVQFALAILAADAVRCQTNWTVLAPASPPAPTCGYAWDSARDVLVTYGGELFGAGQSGTREWNGTSWNVIGTANSPSGRARPAMCFDEARGVTVLFGGGAAFNNDTWTFDGTNWTQQTPSTSPAVRFGAAMAYDKARQVVVMFGGFVPSMQDTRDIWEWDGSNWTQKPPGASAPSRRGAHRMAYDEARGEVILVGGYNTPSQTTLADTWSWDGTTWTQYGLLATSLCDQSLVYDAARQRIVMFGGLNIQGGVLTDLGATFEWEGAWTQRTTTSAPLPRNSSACGFDRVNNVFVVAGGRTGNIQRIDTWGYEPTQSAEATPYGISCATSVGIELVNTGLPYTGLPFQLDIVDAPVTAGIGLIIWGGSNTSWNGAPLPFDLAAIGAAGCQLFTSVDVTSTVLLANGAGGTTWSIPNLPAAAGLAFYTQGAVLDPASPLPFQVDMTAALACVVGNP